MQVFCQDLISVDMPGENGRYLLGHIPMADDVLVVFEHVADRPHCGALETMVDTEKMLVAMVPVILPSGFKKESGKPGPNVIPAVRESGKSQSCPGFFENERSRAVENVDVRMQTQDQIWNFGALVVSGDEVDFYVRIRDLFERRKGHVDEPGGNAASKQEVSPMNDRVHLLFPGGFEGSLVVGKKIFPAASPLNPGFEGKIESQMGIGQEQYFNQTHFSISLSCAVLREIPG